MSVSSVRSIIPLPFQDEVLAGDLRLEPEHTRVSPDELQARLAEGRHDGVAVMSRPRPSR